MKNRVLDGVMGLAVADAVGVPVEFKSRETLAENPVTSMHGYGMFHQPAGTWSDDTSMTLCLVDSLSNGLDYQDMIERFSQWMMEGKYTPFGRAFGIGSGTNEAVMRFKQGVSPLECGGTTEQDNGNGSLMRTLPVLYFLQSTYGVDFLEDENPFEVIHNISALTHGHKRSHVACGIYIAIGSMLLQENDIDSSVKQGISKAVHFYKGQADYADELRYYNRLQDDNFVETSVDEIRSSGYVVDTLEAAIWCLLTTETYEDCVLKAVNLGIDTDTVAAVAGGLAGIYYGYESIPTEWLETLVEKEYIEDLCEQFSDALLKNDV